MGVLHFLARESDRSLFEIGKWFAIYEVFAEMAKPDVWHPFVLPEEHEVRRLIRVAIEDQRLDVDRDAYAAELARRVVAFGSGQPLALVNDSSDLDEYRDENDDLRVIDALYTHDWGDWIAKRSKK